LYSEQYVLGALLVSDRAPFRVVFPNRFVVQNPSLAPRVNELFRSPNGQPPIPFAYPSGIPPVSFWLETTGSSRHAG
jgi:hypothetical protein